MGYYFQSGECDVATFDNNLNQTGEGVRYTRDRDAAYRLVDGQLEGGSIDLEEALQILEIQDTPAIRNKDSIPNPGGYDPARHKRSWKFKTHQPYETRTRSQTLAGTTLPGTRDLGNSRHTSHTKQGLDPKPWRVRPCPAQ